MAATTKESDQQGCEEDGLKMELNERRKQFKVVWTDPVDAESHHGRHHGDVPAVVESLRVLEQSPVPGPGGAGPHHQHQAPGVEDHQDEDHQHAEDTAGRLLLVPGAETGRAAEVEEAPETCQGWAQLEVPDLDVADASSLLP